MTKKIRARICGSCPYTSSQEQPIAACGQAAGRHHRQRLINCVGSLVPAFAEPRDRVAHNPVSVIAFEQGSGRQGPPAILVSVVGGPAQIFNSTSATDCSYGPTVRI